MVIGLLYGSSHTLVPFCTYVFEGAQSNVCSNASSIVFTAWGFKLVFALITDSFRPFGLRRKPWMLFGLCGTLSVLMFLVVYVNSISVSTWLVAQMSIQALLMFSDVPADGYSVELGQLELPEERGQILATG